MPYRKIALITYQRSSRLTPSDTKLIEPLKKAGFKPYAVPWDERGINWSNYDCIILRSCWNYHLYYQDFLNWLSRIEDMKIPVWNPADILRWNSDKKYLLDMEKKGIPVVPSICLDKGSDLDEIVIPDKADWQELVIKPRVGASSHEIFKINCSELNKYRNRITSLIEKTGILIQPFFNEVITEGEYSLVFIGGNYSHMVMKKAKKGDFRVNYEFGGKEILIKPDINIINQAKAILAEIDEELLYARIDGMVKNTKFILTELELIEPHLYFDLDSKSPERFVIAFQEKID